MKIKSFLRNCLRIISPVLITQDIIRYHPEEDTEYTAIMRYHLKIREFDETDNFWFMSMFILVNLCFVIDLFCWLTSLNKDKYGKYLFKEEENCLTEIVINDSYTRVSDILHKSEASDKDICLTKKLVYLEFCANEVEKRDLKVALPEKISDETHKIDLKDDSDSIKHPYLPIKIYPIEVINNTIGQLDDSKKQEIFSIAYEGSTCLKLYKDNIDDLSTNKNKKENSSTKNESKLIERDYDFKILFKMWNDKQRIK
jgi:hypothetical protein